MVKNAMTEVKELVKIIGSVHYIHYWSHSLKKEIEELTKNTKKLGVELTPQQIEYIKKNPFTPYPDDAFWFAVMDYASKQGIEIVPLLSKKIYHVKQKYEKEVSEFFAGKNNNPNAMRVISTTQEKSVAQTIIFKKVDTIIVGSVHAKRVMALLRLKKIPTKLIHFPSSEWHRPEHELLKKIFQKAESKRRRERRQRNIARGLLKPKSRSVKPK